MPARGKLVAIEGIDGSGKRTQAQLLGRVLEARGIACARFSFPRYESSFGRLVGRFLNGEFGPLEAVDAHFSALLYAGDRFESKPELQAVLDAGKMVVTDRYVPSNLAHQTARVPIEQRAEFVSWLRHVEYGIFQLPVEDLVIYLHLDAGEAQEMVSRKAARNYTALKRDLQEADLDHLKEAAAVYDSLAEAANWVTIECLARPGHAKTREEIHHAVLDAVDSRVLARSSPL